MQTYIMETVAYMYPGDVAELDTGFLDTSNNLHIECVCFVFLPLIQTQLDTYRHVWNLHRVRFQNRVSSPLSIPNVPFLPALPLRCT